MDIGNRTNKKSTIWTALSSFTPSKQGNNLTLSALITGVKNALITGFTYADYVAGVNGVYTTSNEGTVVIGTVYQLAVKTNLISQGAPVIFTFSALAATTSFTDLATSFAANINAQASVGNTPFPGVAVVSSTHLRITEVPPSGSGAGGVSITCGAIVAQLTGIVIENASDWGATTAHVTPVGDYYALQKAYSSQQSAQGLAIPEPSWIGNGPVSTSTYAQFTIQYVQNTGDPTKEAGFNTWTVYLDATILTASELAYIKGTIQNLEGQVGTLAAGGTVAVVPIITAPSGVGLIPQGATAVSVTSANSAYFVGLPASLPIGQHVYITNNATGYQLSPIVTGQSINGGTATAGVKSAIPASVTLDAQMTSSTNWLITAQLATGAGTVTAVPQSA